MRILYLSCHIVLEYDELRILNELGHDVFVIGGYMDPKNPHVNTRPSLNINANQNLIDQFNKMSHNNFLNGYDENKRSRVFTKEFLDNFDCIIVMHIQDWIEWNVELFKNRLVILRTIGQNTNNCELKLIDKVKNGLKILRYSPFERKLKNYAGEHGLIRFLKYKSDFLPRQNNIKQVITFGQSIKDRWKVCGGDYIDEISKQIPFKLFGPNNNNHPSFGGFLSYSEQLEQLAKNSAYFYTGTFPASYTLNFMEAMLSGIPIVSISHKLSYDLIEEYPLETPSILDIYDRKHFDDMSKIKDELFLLLEDNKLNELISQKQIKIANQLFSVEENIFRWKTFLNSI
jgi:glycosyltransferase involved in cell wall biosynthesis